jgi:hypothetical protein
MMCYAVGYSVEQVRRRLGFAKEPEPAAADITIRPVARRT